ncbi:unnamed protein product, partial [Musa hybrid cultivar]
FLILQSLVLDFIQGKEDISSEVGAPKARSPGFLPRKRASRHRGKVLSFPRMTQQNPPLQAHCIPWVQFWDDNKNNKNSKCL